MIIDDVKTFILGLNLGNLPAGKQEYYAINITYCVCKPKHDQNINNFSRRKCVENARGNLRPPGFDSRNGVF